MPAAVRKFFPAQPKYGFSWQSFFKHNRQKKQTMKDVMI